MLSVEVLATWVLRSLVYKIVPDCSIYSSPSIGYTAYTCDPLYSAIHPMKHIESDVMRYKHRYTPLDGLPDVRDAADGRHSAECIAFIL